jgi:RNA polymerase sigma-70 factor (ECF subfamily)
MCDVPATDEALMEALSNGDASSLDELVLRYQAPLLGFFYRALAGHRATAADLVQDTFIRVLRTRSYRPGRPFRPWLFAIAANVLRSHRQAATRVPSSAGDELLDAAVDPRPGPEASAAGAAFTQQVGAAIASLPEEYRVTLLLRFGADLSLAEIAATLEVPLGTVKSRLFEGTRRLRELLGNTA